MKSIKDNYELRMIVNVNPLSREKVESGDFCKRENENGVDLNRNYKSHWSKDHDLEMVRTDPGPFAFSQAETQTVRNELKKLSPHVFFSIHSGTLALFTPYTYILNINMICQIINQILLKQRIMQNLFFEYSAQILTDVREKHCETCKMGSCFNEIGYLSPGTSMDYAQDDLKISYSFTFEIYHGGLDVRYYVDYLIKSKYKSIIQYILLMTIYTQVNSQFNSNIQKYILSLIVQLNIF